MPSTGIPSSSSAGSSRGAPSAYTDAGPPERISPFGRRRAHLVDADVVRQQLGEDAELAHPARDQLGVLAAVVEDDDLVRGDLALERELLERLLGDRRAADLHVRGYSVAASAIAPPRAPMPDAPGRAAAACPRSAAPGAIISSARLNSAMSR